MYVPREKALTDKSNFLISLGKAVFGQSDNDTRNIIF